MQDILLVSSLQTLALATCALMLVWCLLRVMDKSSGARFVHIADILRKDPLACAIYYGARFIGACLLVGLII